jgi:ribonuclease P protein component
VKKRLRKQEILRGKDSFREIFEKGEFRKGKYMTCLFLQGSKHRVAFAVSRQVKGAVRRNRIRRRLREVYRSRRREVKLRGALVLFGRIATDKASFDQLENDFRQLVELLSPEK